jgi:hypothetical protein
MLNNCRLKTPIRSDTSARRRQFYRKINEWGFEKNLKESEMRAIAQTHSNEWSGGTIEVKGRKINAEKIQRWQKRQERLKGTTSTTESCPEIGKLDAF